MLTILELCHIGMTKRLRPRFLCAPSTTVKWDLIWCFDWGYSNSIYMNALGRKPQTSGADNFQNTLQGLPDQSMAMGLQLKYLIRRSPKNIPHDIQSYHAPHWPTGGYCLKGLGHSSRSKGWKFGVSSSRKFCQPWPLVRYLIFKTSNGNCATTSKSTGLYQQGCRISRRYRRHHSPDHPRRIPHPSIPT